MKGGEKVPELEELYSGIKDKLYSYIMKLSGNSHIAEEIVQETFCRALEQILIGNSKLNTAWFYTVARHLYFSYIKKQNKYKYVKDLDIKVIWMAVECGSEGFKPKNMSNGLNQYVQWGVPGQLFNPTKMAPAEFDYSSPLKYEKAVIE